MRETITTPTGMKPVLIAVVIVFTMQGAALAQEINHEHAGHDMGTMAAEGHPGQNLADYSAPVGVMGDHTHHAGGWMFSYRYVFMDMGGSRDGTDKIGDDQVLADFMVTPTSMSTQMHMVMLMYAPRDWLTLMGMGTVVQKGMKHKTRAGGRFTTSSGGIGDTRLTALVRIFHRGTHGVHINAGLSLPTGAIDEKDDTPAGPNQQLPYPMQLGSGTVDLLPGLTYTGRRGLWSWGAQATGTVRLGENSRDYSLGNRFDTTTWGAVRLADWVSTSLRLRWQAWGDIKGADPALNPAVVPTADPDLRSGNRIDGLVGLNFAPQAPRGRMGRLLRGHRLMVELGLPLYQNLPGPQLEMDFSLMLGWQWFPQH